MRELRIATRGSALALAQARFVAARLEEAHPGLSTELVTISTLGDRDRTSPVTALTETGAFVRAVQQAVLAGEADVAVHSCKDLPVAGPPGLAVWYPAREAPWDVLVGADLAELAVAAVVGTGSPRRAAQLSLLRPDLEIRGIRGNVDTRLSAVAEGRFRAAVLAEAGLRRLGRTSEIARRFEIEEMVPAPGQGALAVEAPADGPVAELLDVLDDPATRRAVETERALLARTGAGCRSALGAHASPTPDGVTLVAFVQDERGARRATVDGADPEEAVTAMITELGL